MVLEERAPVLSPGISSDCQGHSASNRHPAPLRIDPKFRAAQHSWQEALPEAKAADRFLWGFLQHMRLILLRKRRSRGKGFL